MAGSGSGNRKMDHKLVVSGAVAMTSAAGGARSARWFFARPCLCGKAGRLPRARRVREQVVHRATRPRRVRTDSDRHWPPSLAKGGTLPVQYVGRAGPSGLTWDEKTRDAFLTIEQGGAGNLAMTVSVARTPRRGQRDRYLDTLGRAGAVQARAPATTRCWLTRGAQARALHAAPASRKWCTPARDYTGKRFADLRRYTRPPRRQLRAPASYVKSAVPTQTSVV